MTQARVAAIYRHPVKGFTPEPLDHAELKDREVFPFDRLYAIENGPSGFDPKAPTHISKQKFAVLARSAVLTKFRTRYDDAQGYFYIQSEKGESGVFALNSQKGRDDCVAFLEARLGEHFEGPLRIIEGPGKHRFTDHPRGAVSLLNLDSLQAFSDAIGAPVDPLRFRMNIHFSGGAAWMEDEWSFGDTFRIGGATLQIIEPTVRCKATHANPTTGLYDLDLVPQLYKHFGRRTLGVYARVIEGGRIALHDSLIESDG